MEPRQIQRFEVLGHLGTGGMGTVYRARDPQLERDVAIKLLTDPSPTTATMELSQTETLDLRTGSPGSADDLLQEARMMARLSHPNVLPVYEVGLVDGAVFVVMEHIEGSNLRVWLEQPRTTAEVLDVFAQAGRGLAAAHARGIVHRDFKPENVLVGTDGRIRVADFGLSRLAIRPTNAMVRVDDGRGTPRYMAPELWRGDAATKRSDVFAFSVALGEALENREVPAAVRAAITAGSAEDPTARPELDAILAAIENRPHRRRWLAFAGGGAAVIGVGVALVVMSSHSSHPSCDVDPKMAAGHWDAARRTAMTKLVEPQAVNPTLHDMAARIVAMFDEDQKGIDDQWRATCVASRDGVRTDAQTQSSRSCVERREFELGALVDQVLTWKSVELPRLLEKSRISDVSDCVDTNAAPIKDHAAVAALYKRYAVADDVPIGPPRIAAFQAIEKDAAAIGELELEARAAFQVGFAQGATDQLAAGDASLQRAYGLALELRSTRLQAVLLIERSTNATHRGDMAAAVSLGELALASAEKTSTSASARAHVYSELGHAAMQRGDMLGALGMAVKGLDIVAKDGHRLPSTEMGLHLVQAMALMNLEGRGPEAVKAGREVVDYARALGEHTHNYAIALTVLGAALQYTDRTEALDDKLKALAIMSEIRPPGSADLEGQRMDTANALLEAGRFEEARQACTKVLEASEHNEALRAMQPAATAYLGESTIGLGKFDDGLPIVNHSLELLAAQYGKDQVLTQAFRKDLVGFQLEVGKLDDAERNIAILDKSYRTSHEPHDQRLAYLHGFLGAQLALQRGKARAAEALTRSALAAWDEVHGAANERIDLLRIQASTLIEQRQWQRAREPLTKALALAASTHAREDVVAGLEISLARVEAGVGHKDEAHTLARRSRDVLDRYPGDLLARKQADTLLSSKRR